MLHILAFFVIVSVKLLQTLHWLQKLLSYYYYSYAFPQTLWKNYFKKCRRQTTRSILWRDTKWCSIGTLHFTDCISFSTPSQTHLSLLFQFFWMTVETWLHFPLTTVKCLWTMNPSWKLEMILLHVTNYKKPFKQLSPLSSTLVTFVASIECPDTAKMTGRKKYCTTFKLCGSSWSG